MLWGTFSVLHIITMVLGAALLVGLYFLLKNKSTKTQTTVLGVLSFLGYAAIVYEFFCKGEPLANLPLHLCSINAMILPFVVFTKNKTFGNLLLVWCLGALAALVLNYDMTDDPILSWNVFFYYFPHLVEFGIPILLVALGHVKKDPKCIISTVVISMVIYTIVHFLNLLIISQTGFAANYMFSMRPNNPLVDLFYSWIPCRYWYMYLVLPIVVVYLLAVYSPELVRYFKNKKAA
ncbi:MAG: YwaF family protein [Oscillospiraceae bacterium]|nr:YwaF family protein [Oscillospiraceae bacterium]